MSELCSTITAGQADEGSEMAAEAPDFRQIHDTFRPGIHRYLVGKVGAGEAEDLTQEVFLRVSRGLGTFRGKSQLSTWIYRIASNAAIDRIRTPSFRQASRTSSLDDSSRAESEDHSGDAEASSPDERLLRQQRRRCFQDHLAHLPPTYRRVVELSEVNGLTDGQVADRLGLTLGAVKIRLHRGRARLVEQLRAHCRAEDWL